MNLLSALQGLQHQQKIYYSYLVFAKGSLGMLLNPEHTDSVFDIEDGLRQLESTSELLRFTTKDPTVRQLVKERYLQPLPNLEQLKTLPIGTLGRTYADHLSSNDFNPDYFRKLEVKNDTDYILMRIRQTHDLWHVVTGIDTTPLGEITLKALELSQTHRPMAAVICAGGVFRYLLKQPQQFGDCLDAIAMGYSMGIKAKPLLAMKWEQMWDCSLEEIRSHLNLQ